jgi:hypothetical protein
MKLLRRPQRCVRRLPRARRTHRSVDCATGVWDSHVMQCRRYSTHPGLGTDKLRGWCAPPSAGDRRRGDLFSRRERETEEPRAWWRAREDTTMPAEVSGPQRASAPPAYTG